MTCVTCGVELPEGTARSAMSGQWLCAEHKILAADKSWVSAGPSDSTRIDVLSHEVSDLYDAFVELKARTDTMATGFLDNHLVLHAHLGLTFWQRLRWLLLGR